ncbi:MAG: hypothetical protein BJ554DRAFT_4391 [Olpidium bornovanus]|uniref:Uncharacterized protein n=1 Tax=Olpidium bornovanus TaxID=278681 RepID=A0A8H7ZN39_9FUNG|nr:MAG: hypothetical protein BJ554DRAFT_4391 [Olpidium bornovanus]
MADMIAVNSRFTAATYREAFPSLFHSPRLLYPGIRLEAYDEPEDEDQEDVQPLKTFAGLATAPSLCSDPVCAALFSR